MPNVIQQVQQLGQSIWYDNMRRALLQSGDLKRMIDDGVSGLTSNPSIFEKAIAAGSEYDADLLLLARRGLNANDSFEALALDDLRAAADLFRPVYDRTGGADGFISMEVNPLLANDTESTIREARRLFAALERPNAMIKVPATPAGMPAVRRLISEGININITLIFSLDAYTQVRQAYIAGLEDRAGSGKDIRSVASVASFFVSRVDSAVDAQLEKRIPSGSGDLVPLLGKAAVANAALAYQAFKETFNTKGFEALKTKGARVQRPLWASTGTKNAKYSDVLYVDSLIAADTVNTMPPATIKAFLEHGRAGVAFHDDAAEAAQIVRDLEAAGISMRDVTDKLLEEGVKSFVDSFEALLKNVDAKKHVLLRQHRPREASLGTLKPKVDAALQEMDRNRIVARIWDGDHTVWRPDPKEIVDRLGWLHIDERMAQEVHDLEAFARGVKDAGHRHVVLLGMGGSSLGPEVVRQTFGSAPGYLQLIVLDSTVPSAVSGVTRAIDPAKTIFLVSSKSGSTIEPISLYRHFRALVEAKVGAEAGNSFVAVTDPGTSLESMARQQGFRRTFVNDPNIGGRYSVLSHFGLVPAALIGVDVGRLLNRAAEMRKVCQTGPASKENPGAWLGVVLGKSAQEGKDKATLVTSPKIARFGLWLEQLIAESTGKEGKGIIPVPDERLLKPEKYHHDRLFVYMRLAGDDNAATDEAMAALERAGHPVVGLDLADEYDLGGEFYRWEMATAVAGAVLGVHPFDQPDVQLAKDITGKALQNFEVNKRDPVLGPVGSLRDLLAEARAGEYLAIMAYVRATPEMDAALDDIRRGVSERQRIPVTVGYGPRFLHSTGQLHKGGPSTGLYLQITADQTADLPVPGADYSFGVLLAAQAEGDLKALLDRKRRVVRVHLEKEDPAAVRRLLLA